MNPRWLVLLLLLGGCFKIDVENGKLQCVLNSGKCPDGYYCASDGACWKKGTGPDATIDLAGGASVDLAGTDAPLSAVDLAGASTDAAPPSDLAGNTDKPNGQACGVGGECVSGFCVDGVCCDTQCVGACVACNVSGSVGTCTNVPDSEAPHAGHDPCGPDPAATCQRDGACNGQGACRLWNNVECKPASCDPVANTGVGTGKCDGAGTCITPSAISCTPYVCNAGNTACNTSCTGNGECKSPATCVSNSCGTKPDGASCMVSGECTNGHCVDGYCCNTACGGKCEACDLPATLGICSPVTSGQPHGTRGDCAGKGTTCGGACSSASTSACTFPTSTTTCGSKSCSGTTLTAAATCNSAGACSTPSTSTCPNSLKCNGAGTDCLTSCTGDGDCVAGRYCNADGTCKTTKPNGRVCSSSTECTFGQCIDGYCCNSSCTGSCAACNIGGSLGTCTPIAANGTPVGTRSCAGSAPCKGYCNGTSTACQFPSSSTVCTAQSCTGNIQTNARVCNGAGACTSASTTDCSPYLCGATACRTECAATGECTTSPTVYYCCTDIKKCQTSCTCFVAGTPVKTPDGERAIETIEVGEEVLAFDTRQQRALVRKVIGVERKLAPSLVRLVIGGSAITTTPDHYFWVDGSAWVRAFELRVGDWLKLPSGERQQLGAAESLATGGDGEVVYNLLVDEVDTYFVGSTPVLTHSCTTLSFSAYGASR